MLGDGRPLVLVYSWGASIETEWPNPVVRGAHLRLAVGRRLVWVLRRGMGASQREVDDLSLDAQVSDVAAVVDALALEHFDLWGFGDGTGPCVAYAARHPERVSRLVLQNAYVRGDFMEERAVRALMDLVQKHWSVARRALADIAFPTGPVEGQRWLAAQWRDAIEPAMAARYLEFSRDLDVEAEMRRLAMPVLLLGRRGDRFIPVAQCKAAAAIIPNARFLAGEGDISYAWYGDLSHLDAVIGFLDDRPAPAATPENPFRTMLFTDLEGHTAMMSRLGDKRGREILREHEAITRRCLARHGGQEVKTMGDGFMASFGSAQRALECAIDLQRAMGELPPLVDLPDGLRVRAGINAGEPIAEAGDLFGSSVIAAARIASRARGGQVLVSDVVRQLVLGKGFRFEDAGEHALKGLDGLVRLWELRW